MTDPFTPPWLDPQSPLYGSLDPTSARAAQFMLAYVRLNPTQDTYTPEEIIVAERTVTYVPPFEE